MSQSSILGAHLERRIPCGILAGLGGCPDYIRNGRWRAAGPLFASSGSDMSKAHSVAAFRIRQLCAEVLTSRRKFAREVE